MSIVRHGDRKKFYIRYRDENGTERFVAGLTSKALTKQLEVKILAEVDAKRKGVWKAPNVSAIDLKRFADFLRDKGTGAKHTRDTVERVRRVCAECSFTNLDEIDPQKIQRFLYRVHQPAPLPELSQTSYTAQEIADLMGIYTQTVTRIVRRFGLSDCAAYPREVVARVHRQIRPGSSAATCNHFLIAMKTFCKWAGKPLIGVKRVDTRADRRHDRLALTVQELTTLLEVTRNSPTTWRGLDGPTRALLYLTAMGTGFRVSELASLTGDSLNLNGTPPTATVPAAYTKNGKTAVQPLPSELVDALRGKTGQLFPGTWTLSAAEMLRGDLERANIPYMVQGPDGPEYADFHSLRHSFICNLINATSNLRDAQKLARHSSITLTVDRYGRHVSLSKLAETVNALPRFVS
jgi:integrase